MKCVFSFLLVGLLLLTVLSCSSPGTSLFKKQSPHDAYAQRLKDAGLDGTALGKSWFHMAQWSLDNPVSIKVPFSEQGYFNGTKAEAASYLFQAIQGEMIKISMNRTPAEDFDIYIDLFSIKDSIPDHLLSFPEDGSVDSFEVGATGNYLLRLQPELLKSGNYQLTITTGPSLAYPIKANGSNHIKSFWGASRDGGKRSHEGVDLFAALHTPVVAAADGRVTRVNQNNLGGKVIFMRPKGKNYSLYYAHLDSQLVSGGTSVRVGDTIGLMGNTGNARSTAPHLHFGIYTTEGAIDPLPFINPVEKQPAPVRADASIIGKYMRVSVNLDIEDNQRKYTVPAKSVGYITAASANQYKIFLPDSTIGYIPAQRVESLNTLRAIKTSKEYKVYESPVTTAPVKNTLSKDTTVQILGEFSAYYLVSYQDTIQGWIQK